MSYYEEEYKLKTEKAKGLPDGWTWIMFNDGSGCLKSPDNKNYFCYDKIPYANAGGIEYQEYKGKGWGIYWDSFEEFKMFSEKVILAKYI